MSKGKGKGKGRPPGKATAQTGAMNPEIESLRTENRIRRNQSLEAALYELEQSIGIRLTPAEAKNMPKKPLYAIGKGGKPVRLYANHFRITLRGKPIVQYDVSFDLVGGLGGDPGPEREEAKIARERRFRRIAKSLHRNLLDSFAQNEGIELFRGKRYAYDNEKLLFTNEPIQELEDGEPHEFEFAYVEGAAQLGHDAPLPEPRHYMITLKKTTELSLEFHINPNAPPNASVTRQLLQAVDIITKQHAFSNLIVFGSKIFYPSIQVPRRSLGMGNRERSFKSGKELAFGYHQGSQICDGGLMLNIDRVAGVFYEGGPLIQKIMDFFRMTPEDAALYEIQDSHPGKLNTEFRSLRIETKHLGFKRKIRILGFSETSAQRTYFNRLDDMGRTVQTSVAQYFQQTYKQVLHYPNFPCVKYGSERDPKYLPVELCYLLPDQRNTRKLQEELLAEMTRTTTEQRPWDRMAEIKDAARGMARTQSFRDFGIDLSAEMVKIDARLLNEPTLKYNQNFNFQPHLGGWMMQRPNKVFLMPKVLHSWVIFNLSANRLRGIVPRFADRLVEIGRGMGFNISPPRQTLDLDGRDIQGLNRKFNQFKNQNLQLILCLMPKIDQYYNTIKYQGDVVIGVPTQIVLDSNYNPRSRDGRGQKLFDIAFLSNLLLKIHTKIGGINQGLAIESKPQVLRDRTMVVGIDVTHPSPGDNSPSIAACVGSLDEEYGFYSTNVRINDSRNELVDVGTMIVPLLESFKARRGDYPKKIVAFRDGVSEGQFEKVITQEICGLRAALKKLKPPPELTYVVVQKRHHTRFLPEGNDKLKNGNILPGIVVDNTVCHYRLFDYYLCSHNAMLGTCRPSKYTMLWDENKLNADHIQGVTYHLCYLFARATKSIADPAPVRYAHHAAARAKVHLKNINAARLTDEERGAIFRQAINVDEHLKNILYFL